MRHRCMLKHCGRARNVDGTHLPCRTECVRVSKNTTRFTGCACPVSYVRSHVFGTSSLRLQWNVWKGTKSICVRIRLFLFNNKKHLICIYIYIAYCPATECAIKCLHIVSTHYARCRHSRFNRHPAPLCSACADTQAIQLIVRGMRCDNIPLMFACRLMKDLLPSIPQYLLPDNLDFPDFASNSRCVSRRPFIIHLARVHLLRNRVHLLYKHWLPVRCHILFLETYSCTLYNLAR